MEKCCYCGEKIPVVKYRIPPDYPRDPRNGDLALCDGHGGEEWPTLYEICQELDRRRARRKRFDQVVLVLTSAVGAVYTALKVFGSWGLLAAPLAGLAAGLLLVHQRRAWEKDAHS